MSLPAELRYGQPRRHIHVLDGGARSLCGRVIVSEPDLFSTAAGTRVWADRAEDHCRLCERVLRARSTRTENGVTVAPSGFRQVSECCEHCGSTGTSWIGYCQGCGTYRPRFDIEFGGSAR